MIQADQVIEFSDKDASPEPNQNTSLGCFDSQLMEPRNNSLFVGCEGLD
jgi:hypothetical protein